MRPTGRATFDNIYINFGPYFPEDTIHVVLFGEMVCAIY
jgi:hypothetical protein